MEHCLELGLVQGMLEGEDSILIPLLALSQGVNALA